MKYKLVSHKKYSTSSNYSLEVEHVPSKVAQFIGKKRKVVQYVGEYTVWHKVAECYGDECPPLTKWERCGTGMEEVLTNFWSQIKHDEENGR